MATQPSVTIRDVAKKAGVSVATVSRVLNNSALVTDKTRNRIQSVAEKLRYIPNASARGLNTRRSDIVALLLPAVNGDFFSEVIRGADEAAGEQGYHILVSSHHNDPSEMQAELQVIAGRVDGLLLMAPNQDAHTLRRKILPSNLPSVLLNCRPGREPLDALTVDNKTGAMEVVAHLIGHGHRRIAIIKGLKENIDSRERLEGYRQALKQYGCERLSALEIEGSFVESSGYDAVPAILNLRPRPTAVFASNDAMAVGALSALLDAGVSIPGEIALAGFDDTPGVQYLTPSLTTVKVPISDLGAQAMKRVLDKVHGRKRLKPEHLVLPTELVIRHSCGCQF
ncbi:MAG TPA: LacI family DNA-binding transcriptional regulator [Bacteroidota bacterium]|nr:LacI family DNA-binding transcriptional regulator [Bacteroidota bacterium]